MKRRLYKAQVSSKPLNPQWSDTALVTHSVSTCYKFSVTACKLELTLVVWGWVSPRINNKPKEANEGLRQQEPTNAQQHIQEDGTEDASPRADVERILVSTACYFLPMLFFTCRELFKALKVVRVCYLMFNVRQTCAGMP